MAIKGIPVLASVLYILALLFSGVVLAAEPKYSGFIENYPDLKPDPQNPGVMIWTKPDVDRSIYKSVMIKSIDIFIHPQSEYKGINANDLKAISDAFYAEIIDVMEPEIPVVSKPGPGVVVARVAITNVKLKKKKRGLLGYTPAGFVLTGVQDLAGKRVLLTDATIEGESFDGQTDERLKVIVDTRAGVSDEDSTKRSWDEIKKTLRFYAEVLKKEMLAR